MSLKNEEQQMVCLGNDPRLMWLEKGKKETERGQGARSIGEL